MTFPKMIFFKNYFQKDIFKMILTISYRQQETIFRNCYFQMIVSKSGFPNDIKVFS